MEKIRCIIAGSRGFEDYGMLESSVIRIFNACKYDWRKIMIVSGAANGADKLGEQFAKKYSLPTRVSPAKWRRYGKLAGHIRNCEMAFYASMDDFKGVLVAFWDNNSPGTKHMIGAAILQNIDTYVVNANTGTVRKYNYDKKDFEDFFNN